MADLPNFYLIRDTMLPNGTMGSICDPSGAILCATCELPWEDNAPDKSCIPVGSYIVIRHNSAEHPNTWEITGVPNRSGILLHNGNTENDSLGCIICGDGTGTIDGLPAVLNSVSTMAKLQQELPDTFILTVSKRGICQSLTDY
jgi:hypothetical protein